ncbi:MAG: EF2563 family selenium-dependent molybdenum hydroxylase system protein [Clostridia bacterium]|nr:EF2563 family selenium-dependent molybdenum hydroxylase system protein [Clostridia bacterium]
MLVLIKGAGDLASGVAVCLRREGHQVIMTELPQPTTVRCMVAFSRAVYEGAASVEEIASCSANSLAAVRALLDENMIPVYIGDARPLLKEFNPVVLVDGIIAKKNLGTQINDAPVVIGLGPGFIAGIDCHAVIETSREGEMGRVIYTGSALPDTGIPGNISGYGQERVLRAPGGGIFQPILHIGDMVSQGDVVALVDGQPLVAKISGVLRGLLPAGIRVEAQTKSGDIDPRGDRESCYLISDKALAVGAGVIAAIRNLAPVRQA